MKFDIKNLCVWKEDSLSLQKMTHNKVREIRDGEVVYPFYMGKQFVEVDIADLNLTVRSYNCLKRMGWNVVGDIIQNIDTKQELLKVRNLGRTSSDEIFQNLLDFHEELLSPNEKSIYRKKYNQLYEIDAKERDKTSEISSVLTDCKEKELELSLGDCNGFSVPFFGLMI